MEKNTSLTWKEKIAKYLKNYFKNLNLPLYITFILVAIGLFLLDYFTKAWAYDNLSSTEVVDFIPGLLSFVLVGNKGAAFGSFSGLSYVLVPLSAIASLALLFWLLFRFSHKELTLNIGVVLMFSGAVGNLVDRIGYWAQSGRYVDGVIDFLKFTFWPSFPVCNIADYCLTIGIVVLVVGIILKYVKASRRDKQIEEVQSTTFSEEQKREDIDMTSKLAALENKEENPDNSQENPE